MVMGNISIAYQKEDADAREKWKKVKKIGWQDLTGRSIEKWVEMKISGLKIGVILARWTY